MYKSNKNKGFSKLEANYEKGGTGKRHARDVIY
jgi:hypothetical protein